MAEYITDPGIAASIDDLKRRWPEIGEAADHPLTEFFLKRKGTKKRWMHSLCVEFSRVAVLILAYAVACHMFPGFMQVFGFWVVMAGVWVFNCLERHAKPQKESNLTDPVQLLSGAGDASQWEQLALLPLQYRDVAGICLGYSYHMGRTHQFSISKIVLAFGIVAIAIYYFSGILNLLVFVPCLLFLIFSIHVIATNPSQFLHNRMADLKIAMARGNGEGIRYNIAFFQIVCLVAMVNFICFYLAGSSGVVVDFSMIAWGCVFLIASSCSNRLDLESKFRSLNENGKSKYEKMVAEMINRK